MMLLKKIEWRIVARVLLLFVVLCITSYVLINGRYNYLFILVPLVIYQVVNFCNLLNKPLDEWTGFIESIHYRDFTRFFNTRHAPGHLQVLRKGFNEINTTFKVLSKEKETQYQYLQKILELIDTGILSYEEESGDVVWMNESLKKMLQIPYLKTIHSISKRDNVLYNDIIAVHPRESRLATVYSDRASIKVLISATSFDTDGRKYKLIAFQNVNEALEETESRAWEKLLSVMTHEIMNSIAPISSLAETLKSRLQVTVPAMSEPPGLMDDLSIGIETIRRRSEGLLKFAKTYRQLNKITTLNLRKIYVRDLFETILQLMQPTLDQKDIDIETILKETDLELEADVNLIEQVMINLLVNAMDALKDKPAGARITLTGSRDYQQRPVIRIADNGTGIPAELLDKIFIPFFSTKRSGSGIGLSLCKQIMLLHKGSIQVQTADGEGSAFLLQF